MQIYSKSMKNATSLSFLGRFWFCLFYLIGLGAGFKTSTQNLKFVMQIYANLFKINEKCYFSISWAILILFGLSDRAWWGLQNFYTEFWNSLIMQIYANLFQKKCYFSISQRIFILFVLSDRAWWGLRNFYTEFWNSIIMQIYANLFKINEKCYFSISQQIFILSVLSDRAWWGLRNFYTEFWNSLIMQIYANLFKINKKCYFSISQRILILFVYLIVLGGGFKTWNSIIMQIYANLFKINEKCYFSISQQILILFVLSDRAWWGLRNFYTELWNSLIMQIYSKSMKNATSPLFRNHNRSALPAGTYITHRLIYYPLVTIWSTKLLPTLPWGAQWIRPQTLNCEVPGSNLLAAAVVSFGQGTVSSSPLEMT